MPTADFISHSEFSGTDQRILKLLGQGFSPEMVASAVGVSPSRISQLLATEAFSVKVAELRYEGLMRHSSRDEKYDEIEDKLLKRLESSLGMLFDPMKISRILQTVNQAKRRGISSPEQINTQQTAVQLTMPVQILQQFTMNMHNQVIKAGQQELITVQSGKMRELLDSSASASSKGEQNVQISSIPRIERSN